MKKFLSIVPRWLPSLLLMSVIFAFSSRTSSELPNFHSWDYFIKKGAHAFGYGLLALSYMHTFKWDEKRYWLAWLLAVLYSATDEFHQSFVPGRHSAISDALIFDNLGALIALTSHYFYWREHEKENKQA
ncbi:MAG: VanZ family protein [Anaerolineales bacterium]